jgi:molybdenum cofactor biosynthesis enzyme MoaA
MQKTNTVICIGNGSAEVDQFATATADSFGLHYHGVLNSDTVLDDGVYHTSIYDIKLQELKDKLTDTVKIVVMDQDQSVYPGPSEYHRTIDLAEGLRKLAQVEFINPAMSNPFRTIVKERASFCIMPFISLFKKEDKIKSCCYMDDNKIKTTELDIEDIKGRISMGLPVPACNHCYQIEQAGAISPRQTYTIDWSHRLNLKSIEDVERTTRVDYDIRLNNECNAMCRSCGPQTSNLLGREYFKLNLVESDPGLTPLTDYDIINLETVQRVYISGGEPTIQSTLFDFLDKCIARKRTDFEIVINTNAAVVSRRLINTAKQFTNLKFEISIDGFGDANYYIRYPIKWDKFVDNVATLNEITNGKVTFNTVVSIYNIARLYPLFEYLETTYPASRYNASFLVEPIEQRFQNFTNKELALANVAQIKRLKAYHTNEVFKSQIDSIISQLKTAEPNRTQLDTFFKFNDRLDASRNVILADYIPELEQCRDSTTKQT